MNTHLHPTDQALAAEALAGRETLLGPRLGDFVCFQTGEVERFSHMFDDRVQTSPIFAGSIFLFPCGSGSFSGSLNPPIPRDSLQLTGETKLGKFWFFHLGQAVAGGRVDFVLPCRVYNTQAQYKGFVSPGI